MALAVPTVAVAEGTSVAAVGIVTAFAALVAAAADSTVAASVEEHPPVGPAVLDAPAVEPLLLVFEIPAVNSSMPQLDPLPH